jgi:poly [ADP-ribose] polymerase
MTDLSTMLIFVDPRANSNKFYEVRHDGSTVHIRYGRVGEEGVRRIVKGDEREYYRAVDGKKRKGYVEASVASNTSPTGTNHAATAQKAKADLTGGNQDPRLSALIDRIVAVNAHEIAVLSGGKIAVRDGQVSTPLGLLTLHAITEAEVILSDLAKDPKNPNLLGRYLTLVPQNVGRGRDWTESFFSGARTVDQQRQFLDQLRQSVTFSRAASASSEDVTEDGARAFAYLLTPVDDKKVRKEIEQFFTDSRNARHPSAKMRIANIFALQAPDGSVEFDKTAGEIGNVKRMWHGTRAFNVLSILASGMKVPSRSASNVTGRMFGDGLYFSEQSTKSLNYSRGGMWSSGTDSRALMFVADVAMGTPYWPNHAMPGVTYNQVLDGKVTNPKSGKTFNSINVMPGKAGVLNHEAIVPGPAQVALRYLVEFED